MQLHSQPGLCGFIPLPIYQGHDSLFSSKRLFVGPWILLGAHLLRASARTINGNVPEMALSCMPCQVFFILVQMSLEPCLIKHSGRWMGEGTAFFLSLPANIFLAQHQHGFSQATVLSYSVLLKPNLARALSCLLLLQRRLQI